MNEKEGAKFQKEVQLNTYGAKVDAEEKENVPVNF